MLPTKGALIRSLDEGTGFHTLQLKILHPQLRPGVAKQINKYFFKNTTTELSAIKVVWIYTPTNKIWVQFSSVAQSCLTLCDSMNHRHQASLSITNPWSLPKLMSIESVMPSNHLILCRHLFLLPSIFPSIRVFSNESFLPIWWPKYRSFSFSISPPMKIQD